MKTALMLLPLLATACSTTSILAQPPVSQSAAKEQPSAPIEVIGEMRLAIDRAISEANRVGNDKTLVIFDLDSTLLRNNGKEPDIDSIRDTDPDQFRATERAVIYLSRLVPMEAAMTEQLERLRAADISSIVLTARGADMRDMTLREMEANRTIAFAAPECGPPLCNKRGLIPAEDVLQAAKTAMGVEELARVGFERGRVITVGDGLVTAAGLDKGVVLRALLASFGQEYRSIIFVDDAEKNVINVARVAPAMPQRVTVFHYRGPARPPEADRRSKEQVNADWAAATKAICKALSPRWCDENEAATPE
jgi:Protein of unknown function (DUF2608)